MSRRPRVAHYVGFLDWQCPHCNSVNQHSYPNARRNISEMFNTLRECNSCRVTYKLGRPTAPTEEPPQEPETVHDG